MHRILLPLALLVACNGDDDRTSTPTDVPDPTTRPTSGEPVVVVTGAFHLGVGETAQLEANTVNGADGSYTWASSDEVIATVEDGLVTTHNAGEVTITATGASTGASGILGIVVSTEVPNLEEWSHSAHADRSAEAFNHWNEDGAVPVECAGCHTTPGFQDRIGADGSAADVVDTEHETGSVVECEACHNPAADDLAHVVFPSGVLIEGVGPEAVCLHCHQGRSSTDDVEDSIASAGVGDDELSPYLSLTTIHYYAAGATLYAGEVRGGYQYADQVYDWRFRHVPELETCVGCHDPHSLELDLEACGECHAGVELVEDVRNIRMMASLGNDYDGDGNLLEGLADEVEGVSRRLLDTIQAYVVEQGLSALCYDVDTYPFFFVDTDGDGACSVDEADYANAYSEWTPRLVRAAYNYQVAKKDPGAFAHNGKYVIQLLNDSATDLNSVLASPIDLSALVRNDSGHFNGAGEAARHWDEDAEVSASCSRCHGGSEGFSFYLQYGVGTTVEEQANGLDCATCHADFVDYTLVDVDSVLLPSGVEIERADDPNNICMTCHSGRSSAADVDAAIASGSLSFKNVHYLAAAATKLGADGAMGYQYPGKLYVGEWVGHFGGDGCVDCHNAAETDHSFQVADNMSYCIVCHTDAVEPSDIRSWPHQSDFDGDGDVDEPLAGELETLAEALYARMQTVAAAGGTPLCYDEHVYPYWFNDTDGDRICSVDEATYSNGFTGWTADLLPASFNYQLYLKEPGAWAHNFDYMAELLIDSNEALGGDVTGFVRP